ncbi:MGH1-like glycoside hydrolase domain-containing protein [Streptomyces yokosukanensis]|uniref:MGH1-like glycoside hydrolase domain-containing protein n=1 Tax=Streptomyces yokosukanensis TaxID=67386 RepID=UPI003F4CB1E8
MDRSTQLTARPTECGIACGPPVPGTSLRITAARVLDANWTGSSTVPSRDLYPHQWSWDSAFIAIGLRHVSPRRAQTELETLLAAQWADGRVPHIVFNPSVPLDAYFPSPDFWRSSTAGRTAGAPRTVQTSGIVQPPVHALAAWLVHCADPGLSRSRGFLARVYPRLAAWHRYLLHRRDLGGAGLVSVVHPWEQGMDNSPCWDAPLARITPAPARSFRRADLAHTAPEDRPTDLDYGRYVRLAADYRDAHYADGGGEFAVEDPAFNALLIASEHALARIAGALGALGTARHTRAERLTAALVERLWDPAAQMFLCRDLHAEPVRAGDGSALIRERGVSGLVPLLLPGLPREVVAALVRTLCGAHFGLGDRTLLVPSYDLLGEAFDPHRYWRGPAWFNTGWLLERGLRLHGERERADALRAAVLRLAEDTGFAEYVDPHTGEPCGATGFGWTAALALDLYEELRQELRRDQRQEPHKDLPKRPGEGVSKAATGTFDKEDEGGDRG